MAPTKLCELLKLSVIGCGYLGAVHAACMAQLGHDVIGIDVDAKRIETLSKGRSPFYEPGLTEILLSGVKSGKLHFTTEMADARNARVHFIAVGTPQHYDSQGANLAHLYTAIKELVPYLSAGDLVVGKSTVPVGTANRLAVEILDSTGAILVWNPEFLREGSAINDTLTPDRLVYGLPEGEKGLLAKTMLDIVYATTLNKGTPLVIANYATAELVKVAANAFLATRISFINAMAEIAEVTGADVTRLADAMGFDSRIGRSYLNAGIGFGGACLPKDIHAFIARAEELGRGESVAFLKEVDSINMRRRDRMLDLVVNALEGQAQNKKVAVLGLAFKPDSDDIRDSPALDIAIRLHELGSQVVATDPKAIPNSRSCHPELTYAEDLTEALQDADVTILLTEWKDFINLNPEVIRTLVNRCVIIDGRNCLNSVDWRAAGWVYHGLGCL